LRAIERLNEFDRAERQQKYRTTRFVTIRVPWPQLLNIEIWRHMYERIAYLKHVAQKHHHRGYTSMTGRKHRNPLAVAQARVTNCDHYQNIDYNCRDRLLPTFGHTYSVCEAIIT
jgi:hypothetical protein